MNIAANILDAVELPTRLVLAADFHGEGDRLKEDGGAHDALEPILPNDLNNVEQSVSEENVGRFVNEKAGVQPVRHTGSPTNATTERGLCAGFRMNKPLQSCPVSGRNNKCESFLPVTFDGMLDRNVPLPTYKIAAELLPCGSRHGRPLSTGGRPTLSSMET